MVQKRDARLFRHESDRQTACGSRSTSTKGALPLSDAVPALENFGFAVMESSFPLDEGRLGRSTISRSNCRQATMRQCCSNARRSLKKPSHRSSIKVRKRRLQPAGARHWPVRREADWLRAFYRYLRQTGMGFTIYTVVDALCRAPGVTCALVELFRALHDPDFADDRKWRQGSRRPDQVRPRRFRDQ
ncbi:MAG: NAD-glutamate dehydrogenase [Altererythrobacter sp.]